jgi:hypothetical protein
VLVWGLWKCNDSASSCFYQLLTRSRNGLFRGLRNPISKGCDTSVLYKRNTK